ncbi:MAG TPA: hypothetical protein VMH86_02570 [Rhizomicrobium sp.]|nr:hypothetical protein [Rhizomicrobium sp.]
MTTFGPLEVLLYFVAPPLAVLGLWMSWQTWREDHPRKHPPRKP